MYRDDLDQLERFLLRIEEPSWQLRFPQMSYLIKVSPA
jgi:hypothetical protein